MGYELEQLKEFIRSELKKGYAVDTVKSTLASSGFSKAQIKKAFATLHRKEKVAAPAPVKVAKPKPKGPGMFSGWFKSKPKAKKPKIVKKPVKKVIKKVVKKPVKKPVQKPKKKGQGLFSRFFFTEAKPKQIKKTLPKPKPIPKKIAKPKKPSGPGLFSRLFASKSKTIKTKKVKIKIKPKPKPKPIKPKKPKRPSIIGKILSIILYRLRHPKQPKPIARKEKGKRRSHLSPPFLLFYLIMFFVIIALIIYIFPATCVTEECFVLKANNCESATFRNVIGGTTLYYETDDCYLVKTVTRMSDDEPKVMQDRFLRKSMTCSYNQGDFDPLYVNTISAHLNTCEGELREGILKVLL